MPHDENFEPDALRQDFDARKAFYTALAAAQAEIDVAVKTRENPHFRSKYADMQAVTAACKAALAKHGICYMQFPDFHPETKTVSVKTILAHSGGFERSFTLSLPVSKLDAQGVGSAITYARRFALASAFGVVSGDEDDDANEAVAEGPEKQPASKNKDARDLYSSLQDDIGSIEAEAELKEWAAYRKGDIDRLPDDWKGHIREQYRARMILLTRNGAAA